MARQKLIPVRVFVACTGDLCEEREAVKTEIDKINTEIAEAQGYILQFLDWRRVSSSVGPLPEEVVLDELPIEQWDIFIGILWHRFGTPTGVADPDTGQPYEGGTEQEFKVAHRLSQEQGRPIIRFYHRTSDLPFAQTDPDQLKKVKAFLAEFEPAGSHPGLVECYTDLEDFKDKVRKGLIKALDHIEVGDISAPSDEDASVKDIPALHLDQQTLTQYFQLCDRWPSDEFDWKQLLADLETPEQTLVKSHLLSGGLLCQDEESGDLLFTDEGALFCCEPFYIPRYRLHIDVQLIDDREVSGGASKSYFWGSTLNVFFRLHKQLADLWQPRGGRADVRDSSGSEAPVLDYPQVAIVEALANFIIHRDYHHDECGYITLRQDRVEFLNPGCSEVPIFALWEAMLKQERQTKKGRRNRRLIEAFNKARINQYEGGGLIRIYDALDEHRSYKPNGEIGLELTNYDDENSFELVIYKRPPPHEMDAVLAGRLKLAREELARGMKDEAAF